MACVHQAGSHWQPTAKYTRPQPPGAPSAGPRFPCPRSWPSLQNSSGQPAAAAGRSPAQRCAQPAPAAPPPAPAAAAARPAAPAPPPASAAAEAKGRGSRGVRQGVLQQHPTHLQVKHSCAAHNSAWQHTAAQRQQFNARQTPAQPQHAPASFRPRLPGPTAPPAPPARCACRR